MTPILSSLSVLHSMAEKTLEDCAQLPSASDASSEEKYTRHAPGVLHPRLLLDRLTRHYHFHFRSLLRQKKRTFQHFLARRDSLLNFISNQS